MQAGRLRHRVAVEAKSRVQNDGEGDVTETFVPRGYLWASIEPISGRELLRADVINAELDTRITVRWSPLAAQIDATWRIRHRSIFYNVALPPMEKSLGHREIEIMCKSGLNAG